ncbi:MAG TPA: hypothetical protein VER58_01215 [Thermoanaerobaculia bacterium]|nr:hypothetical protein [Thermoanaerobaculia bacterium]
MLWYKSWLETRWRFLIGLALLLCSAAATVFTYPQVMKLLPMVPTNVSGPLGERIREAAELARDYRGYVWSQWFQKNGSQWATLFAILLGTAGLLSQSNGALFTLSLPVSRARLLGIRAATGLSELLLLAFVPSLLIPMLSPAIRESYGVGNALVHSVCLFVAASVFFSLAFLLSTVFDDLWPPLLIALAIAIALGLLEQILRSPSFKVYRVMSAETYFRTGHVPWLGLLTTAAASAALCYGAVVNIQRRDF